jgi:hypothetical protein
MTDRLQELYERGTTSHGRIHGDALCCWAYDEIVRLRELLCDASRALKAHQMAPTASREALALEEVAVLRVRLNGVNHELERLESAWPLMAASNLLYFESRRLANERKDREPLLVHVRALNTAIDEINKV